MATQEPAADGTISDEEIIDLEQPIEDTPADQLPTDPEELKALLEKERIARRQVTARAKNAEAENKILKTAGKPAAPVAPKKPEEQQSSQSVDERILLSQGEDQEFLDELKEIAEIKKISLIEAKGTELGVAAKKIYDDKKAKANAQMGAGRGAGSKTKEITANTPGLSDEQHKKLALEAAAK
jgi:hypothetical protein